MDSKSVRNIIVTTLTNSCTHYTKCMDAKITLKIHIKKSHIKTTPTCFGTQGTILRGPASVPSHSYMWFNGFYCFYR